MTAALASIQASMAEIQARIAAISTPVQTASSSTTTSSTTSSSTATGSTSAQSFAAALATSTTPTTSGSGTTGEQIVADAKQYLGVPYVWGGESRSGLDCSGLVQKTFGDLGISLPRTAAEQQRVGTPVDSLADAQPGDLLFFGQPAYHVAIYAGDGKLVESPEPGKTVHVTDVYQTPTSIRRISASTTPATTAASHGISPAVAAYSGQFTAAEQAFGLPTGLLAAVAQQESGGNSHAVSPAGAEGLMQLMPATAAGLGVDAFDPSQSITAAAKILSRNLAHFNGSIPLALAGYNAGVGAVDQYGGIPPYAETQNYVRKITATLAAGG